MLKYLPLILLSGCGADYSKMPAATQPRALLWGASNPQCVAFCEIGVSVSQGEKNSGTNTQSGGAITQGQTYSPQDNDSTSVSLGKQ